MTQKKLETAIHTHFGKNLALTKDAWQQQGMYYVVTALLDVAQQPNLCT